MMKNYSAVRVRFAPSPTGYLHVGGLRTAVFNWLFARHNKGAFLLRMEDTDIERSTQEYADSIGDSLIWAELMTDEPIVVQSARVQEHKKVLEHLVASGKAYYCYCSQEDVVVRYEKKTEENFFVQYDGYCRDRIITETNKKKSYVIRFALPRGKPSVVFDDLIRGTVVFEIDQLDDFIIARSDGRPMYNFVVVVDDAFMHISHVIRGEDHISNTPKQILLYQACGYPIPHFAHLPMILGPSGDRLSKRDGAMSVLEYKNQGYLPQALINYLVRLGWAYGDQEIFTKENLIDCFSLDNVGKKGAIFDPEKLAWVNSVYIHEMLPEQLRLYITKNIRPDLLEQLNLWSKQQVNTAIMLYKDRVKILGLLVQELLLLHNGPKEFCTEEVRKWVCQDDNEKIHAIIKFLEKQTLFTHDVLTAAIKELAQQLGVKLVNLAQPVRIALIGKAFGPGVFKLLAIVGRTESIRRLQILLDYAQGIQSI